MEDKLLERLGKKYPFLSVCKYAGVEFIGIIQNSDNAITSIYDFGQLPSQELKILFLELGETWWWESNRTLPIHLFLKKDWAPFKPYVRVFTNKNLEILSGPVTSLNSIIVKRKKRSITLVKKV